MLLREESGVRVAWNFFCLGMTFVATIAHVVPSRTKRLLGVVGRVHLVAVIPHRRLVLDAILSDLLHC